MPTPEFVLSLREKVGHDLLWLSGVTGLVRDDRGRVLLGRRSDTGDWALPSGILEPGEHPAAALAREVREEACVEVAVDALLAVVTQPPMAYPNGDRSQYLDLAFSCTATGGDARVGDGELTEVGWFEPDALPDDLRPHSARILSLASRLGAGTWFETVPDDRVLATVRAGDHDVAFRAAVPDDLTALVTMLADDQLGATREDPTDLGPYADALAALTTDPSQLLLVADDGGRPVGMLQLSVVPGLSRRGATRGTLEGVRVAASHRGSGLGSAMVAWAVQECRRRGCAMVQLTSDATRTDARRFYERLGFTASHVGFKLTL